MWCQVQSLCLPRTTASSPRQWYDLSALNCQSIHRLNANLSHWCWLSLYRLPGCVPSRGLSPKSARHWPEASLSKSPLHGQSVRWSTWLWSTHLCPTRGVSPAESALLWPTKWSSKSDRFTSFTRHTEDSRPNTGRPMNYSTTLQAPKTRLLNRAWKPTGLIRNATRSMTQQNATGLPVLCNKNQVGEGANKETQGTSSFTLIIVCLCSSSDYHQLIALVKSIWIAKSDQSWKR